MDFGAIGLSGELAQRIATGIMRIKLEKEKEPGYVTIHHLMVATTVMDYLKSLVNVPWSHAVSDQLVLQILKFLFLSHNMAIAHWRVERQFFNILT